MKKVKKQLAHLFDATQCINCGACTTACAQTNYPDLINEFIPAWNTVCNNIRQVKVEKNRPMQLLVQCQQCSEAPCVTTCPFGANYYDENGLVRNDPKRCIGCNNKPCQSGCPVGIDIPEFIAHVAEGDFEAAYQVINRSSSLPAVCGRVCPQESQCEGKCTRGIKNEPVAIGRLERFVADWHRENVHTAPIVPEWNGHKVAIIGAGPAGLTAAGDLAKLGYKVTVYEALHVAGGVLMYGIPEFRLPKAIVQQEIDGLKKMGVDFECNMVIGKVLTIDELMGEYGYEAVFVGSGAGLPRFMGIPGESLKGVYSANEYLTRINLMKAYREDSKTPIKHSGKVAVVGGGNTAMDACRTAVRLGAKEVYVVYRRTEAEMPAEQIEIDEAREEGVVYKFLTNPAEIIGENGKVKEIKLQVMELGEPDESGRRRPVPVPGKFEMLPVTCVIGAIGQKVNVAGFEGVQLNNKGIIAADETSYRTSMEGVFAVGDATNQGASIAIEAIGEARRCAKVVDLYLHGVQVPYQKTYLSVRDVSPEDYKDFIKLPRAKMPTRDPEERKHDFEEINLGFSEAQARAEASRCLDCGCFDFTECKLIRCANLYELQPEYIARLRGNGCGKIHPSFKEKRLVAIERDQGKCILCNQCVRICDEVVGKSLLGLVGRGFSTVIRPEFQKSDAIKDCLNCLECAEACPTGALRIRENELED